MGRIEEKQKQISALQRVKELEQERAEASQAYHEAMGEARRAGNRLREISEEMEKLCLQLPEGHDYQKQAHCISGHGHYWNCARCDYGAPGRHHLRPSGHLR